MKRKRIEIEAKFPLMNRTNTIRILEKVGKKTEDNVIQNDTYFTPAHINFLNEKPITKWLRVRNTNTETTINFKDWSSGSNDKKIKCKEIEVGLDDYDGILEILNALDFRKIIVVNKTRSSYLYKGIILSIDTIVNLGDFIELEYSNNIYDSEEESLNYIKEVLTELNIEIGNQIFAGYPQLILENELKKD